MGKKRRETLPEERRETLRATLRRALSEEPQTARDLAGLVGIRERDVEEHLAHLERTLIAQGMRLVIEPAECDSCGYRFVERKRFTPPSRCPECHSERIEPPSFRVVGKDGEGEP